VGVEPGGDRGGSMPVERLMRAWALTGAVRGKKVRTTVPDPDGARAPDLVNASSRRVRRIGCGWRISPTCRPGLARCTPRSPLMCSPGKSSAGQRAPPKRPAWFWTRLRGGYAGETTGHRTGKTSMFTILCPEPVHAVPVHAAFNRFGCRCLDRHRRRRPQQRTRGITHRLVQNRAD
jgi:hypothetical protein